MKRREFLSLGVTISAGAVAVRSALSSVAAFAADAKPTASGKAGDKKASDKGAADKKSAGIADKDILHEGQPATIANYCEDPKGEANKYCPDRKNKPGKCKECTFYNKDNTETTFKGKKYAHCQLLSDPAKAQYVWENAYCATFVKQS